MCGLKKVEPKIQNFPTVWTVKRQRKKQGNPFFFFFLLVLKKNPLTQPYHSYHTIYHSTDLRRVKL